MKTEASQDIQQFDKIKIKKQRSERLFVLHSHLQQQSKFADKSNFANNHQLPPVQISQESQETTQELHQQAVTQRLEYIKLPEIDEKFFLKHTFKPQVNLINASKFKSHSHQPSRNEIELANESHFDQNSHRKVEFNQNVQIIDYINNALTIGGIDGSSKPIKQFRRQQTRFIKDELSRIPLEQRKRNIPELRHSELFDFFDNNQVSSNRNQTLENQF